MTNAEFDRLPAAQRRSLLVEQFDNRPWLEDWQVRSSLDLLHASGMKVPVIPEYGWRPGSLRDSQNEAKPARRGLGDLPRLGEVQEYRRG